MANSHDILTSFDGTGIAVERMGDASKTLWSDAQGNAGHFVAERAAPKPTPVEEIVGARLAAAILKRLARSSNAAGPD